MRILRRVGHVVTRLPFALWFVGVFLWDLVIANVKVAREVVTPGFQMQAGIVRVPTHCRTDLEMLSLANTITMTPGTLSLEVDTETRDLYVHSLYVTSREAFIADVHKLERIMLKALR
jgi:multicomponent Na+:H+ antiporter subunit E